jgi:demethylmenaquinone methyltransferase/2-methoxy-6-polyprenyl-1,4-benzoquinol methylase
MGFFNWAAPAFDRLADRWSPDDVGEIAGWIRPFVGPGGHLIDVGGGTGALAVKLADALEARVTVLDPTPEMIKYVPDHGSVESLLGSAEEMPLASDDADAIIVTDAFHHFRDQPAAADEFKRVIRGGGGVVVIELDPRGFLMRSLVTAEKILGEPGSFFTPDEMCAFFASHGIAGECTAMSGPSYRFVGAVEPGSESAGEPSGP